MESGTNYIIKHDGIITNINNQLIFVTISSQAACSTCHAKGACNAFDSQEKVIEVKNHKKYSQHKLGDKVVVAITQKMGFSALFLAHLLPLVIVVTTIVIGTIFTKSISEGVIGLTALSTLLPYYYLLYLFRAKISRVFDFEINPLQ